MQDMESAVITNLSKYKKLYEKKLCCIYEKYDLRKIDMEITVYLAKCGKNDTARDIANTNMFTKGHISQSVKRLIELGYVSVVHDDRDMRVQHLRLTDKVKPMLDELLQHKRDIEKCVFEGISEDEIIVIQSVFEKMCKNINNKLEEA